MGLDYLIKPIKGRTAAVCSRTSHVQGDPDSAGPYPEGCGPGNISQLCKDNPLRLLSLLGKYISYRLNITNPTVSYAFLREHCHHGLSGENQRRKTGEFRTYKHSSGRHHIHRRTHRFRQDRIHKRYRGVRPGRHRHRTQGPGERGGASRRSSSATRPASL